MSEPTVGAWVKCKRVAASKGTWPRYDGKVGRIISRSGDPESTELAVEFPGNPGERVLAWFQPDELEPSAKPRWGGTIRVRPIP